MLTKLRPHLFLALIYLGLTLGQQYLFYLLKGFPIVFFSPSKYFILYFVFFVFTLVKGQKSRIACLSFFIFLCPWQLGHLSYYGTQVLPAQIYQMIVQAGEVTGALKEEFAHFLIPFIFLIIPMVIGIFAVKKIETTFKFRFLGILFALYLIYNPVRTYLTGNTWGRQPSTRELAGMNIYLSLSYFFGRIVPYKLSSAHTSGSNLALQLEVTKIKKPDWDHVVIILGESLTPNHMELFGYDQPTTPFLLTQKKEADFFSTTALSSGVSTDVSVAFFLNLGYGESGVAKAGKANHCLFKLAKEQGYSTHFLSIQSEEQLRYISPFLCTAFMDDSRSLEQIAPEIKNQEAAPDEKLLPQLEKILASPGSHFVMLHQRGSHAPWGARSVPEHRKFFSKDPKGARVADYDNSVVEFDLFIQKLFKILQSLKGKVLFYYISDHGESLGENGKWGHGFLIPEAFEVPLLIRSFHHPLPVETKTLPKYLTQYNASLYIVNQLGFKTNQSSHEPTTDFVIFGNDIDGFAGKLQISFPKEGKYTSKLVP
jgi:glucan phosphoethanolaminetransferase (alkaline phosphatase superfamily)